MKDAQRLCIQRRDVYLSKLLEQNAMKEKYNWNGALHQSAIKLWP